MSTTESGRAIVQSDPTMNACSDARFSFCSAA
jgi:hypothetical protein